MRTAAFAAAGFLLAVFSCAGSDADDRIAATRARFEAAMDACARALVEEAEPSERADSALAVGAIYELGLTGDPDPMQAAFFYSLASDIGSAEADCALGNIYSAGVESGAGSIGRDMAMAVEYYGRAAVGGSVKAMLELGRLYADGSPETPRDPKKALAHFMNAASRGSEEAMARLEPVMAQAREWESRRPGRKANFPTRREDVIKPELERADRLRSAALDRTASRVYVELNRRIAEAVKSLSE